MLKNVMNFKFLGRTVTYRNCLHGKIKNKMQSGGRLLQFLQETTVFLFDT